MYFAKYSIAIGLATSVLLSAMPTVSSAHGQKNRAVTVYFTRHAEKETTTSALGAATDTYELMYYGSADATVTPLMLGEVSKGSNRDDVCGTSKCAEELSDLGLLRAQMLADWFDQRRITHRLDAVYSSHKVRTYQTVEVIASRAGIEIQQLPADGTELEPESTSPSECPTVDAVLATAPGDTIVVAGHSGTLYDIMGAGNDDCAGLGLDTSSDRRFPKDEDGKVRDFGDIWKVKIRNGEAQFVWRKNLQPAGLEVVNATH